MNDFQKDCTMRFVESGALSAILERIDTKLYEKFKLSVDKPDLACDTINMIRGLREIQNEFQHIMNESLEREDAEEHA